MAFRVNLWGIYLSFIRIRQQPLKKVSLTVVKAGDQCPQPWRTAVEGTSPAGGCSFLFLGPERHAGWRIQRDLNS